MSEPYDEQARGDGASYERYLAGMDASMRQKVALTAAHLLCEGEIADMGMGSGAGSHALAALYPDLSVIGVDINPEMVERAAERYDLPNLSFQQGDIAARCFPEDSLEAIVDSSVLHHVTSFNGYDRAAAPAAIGVQASQLVEGGVLIIRDFLDPGEAEVFLDLPLAPVDFEPEADSLGLDYLDDPRACSPAALLERFSREFRSLSDAPGFPLNSMPTTPAAAGSQPPLAAGHRRYRLSLVHAVEFVLRKDYRRDWELEVQEEYTYLTQRGFEGVFARLGLRLLASTPIYNPWIVKNRFEGQFQMWTTDGRLLDWPATNYVAVGQKVAKGAGVRFDQQTMSERSRYLQLCHWRHKDTGQVFDLARRPGVTVDVLPWFEKNGQIYVLARRSYPRPILGAREASPPIDWSRAASWVTEPLTQVMTDRPLGQTVEDALDVFAGIGSARIISMEEAGSYYPSPGGLQEQVRAVFVQIEPVNVDLPLGRSSGFSDSGHLRAIEARQLLRAGHVGGLPDARLELNVYGLLRRLGRGVGPWIGGDIGPPPGQPISGPEAVSQAPHAALSRPPRRRFLPASAGDSAGFLHVQVDTWIERDRHGRKVAEQTLESVLPATLSSNTVAVALLRRRDGIIEIAVADDDLPAAQCFTGQSQLLVAPAWRLPKEVYGWRAAMAWVQQRLVADYGVSTCPPEALGGRYHPSAGVTCEVVWPVVAWLRGAADAAEVKTRAASPKNNGAESVTLPLIWVPLGGLTDAQDRIMDGHLRVIVCRADHALRASQGPR